VCLPNQFDWIWTNPAQLVDAEIGTKAPETSTREHQAPEEPIQSYSSQKFKWTEKGFA